MNFAYFMLWMALGFAVGIVYDSLFEWLLHRFVMHKKVAGFDYSYNKHAMVHHRVFRADSSYHLLNEADKETVPMAWWNGPVLIVISQIPFALISWWTGEWAIVCGSFLACCLYYAAYEYMHWCMHIPRKR